MEYCTLGRTVMLTFDGLGTIPPGTGDHRGAAGVGLHRTLVILRFAQDDNDES